MFVRRNVIEPSKLTPKELAAMTIRDLEKIRKQREKGSKEATSFTIERTIKTNRKINRAKRRGNRSF